MIDDDVWRQLPFGPLPTLIAGLVGLGLLVAVTLRRDASTRWPAIALLSLTVLAILAATLAGGDASLGREVNLRPGAGIRGELDNVNHTLGVVNVLGNLALFVPLGWLAAVLVSTAPSAGVRVGLSGGTVAGLALSAAIETTQYAVGRVADVDDVLLNTAGALLGAIVGVTLNAVRRSIGGRPQPESL